MLGEYGNLIAGDSRSRFVHAVCMLMYCTYIFYVRTYVCTCLHAYYVCIDVHTQVRIIQTMNFCYNVQ